MSARRRPDFWTAVLLLAIAVVAVLLVWPLGRILAASLIDNRTGEVTLGNYARVLGQPFFQTALVNSLIVGVGGMAGAMLLGVPLAVLTTRYLIAGPQPHRHARRAGAGLAAVHRRLRLDHDAGAERLRAPLGSSPGASSCRRSTASSGSSWSSA